MTALRFQTGGRHQTSPASLRGEYQKDYPKNNTRDYMRDYLKDYPTVNLIDHERLPEHAIW